MSEAAQAVEPVLDAAEDVILEGIDGTVEVIESVREGVNVKVVGGVLFVVGAAAGAVGGYFFAKKKLRSFYEDLAEVEITQAKEFYKGLNKVGDDGEVLSPMDVLQQRHGVDTAVAALREYQGEGNGPFETEDELIAAAVKEQGEPHDDVVDEAQIAKIERDLAAFRAEARPETAVETTNVFNEQQFDLEEEIKYRTEDKPYIITHDEYFAAEKDYDQHAVTYFETDDTLVDDQDRPLEGIDGLIGDDHLVMFGRGSKDRNVVYIRNDTLGIDYEVTKSEGSYLLDVLGMGDEPDTGQRDRRRAFRRDDE